MDDFKDSAQSRPARKRMTVFRAADEGNALIDHMPLEGIDEGVLAAFAKIAAAGVDINQGTVTKCLFQEPVSGLSLCYGWFKSNYLLPRHSHNADCVYYVLRGELQAGATSLRAGDGIFVPADDAYAFQAGPEGAEFLEFRNATQFHFLFKGNDEAHWDRIKDVHVSQQHVWPDEKPPTA